LGIIRRKKIQGDGWKMNFIRKIFEDKADDLVHEKFKRFGKGEYTRALLSLKKSKKLLVKSSYEFTNDLVKLIIENAKGDIAVSGLIISTKDVDLDIEYEKTKRGKLHKYNIKKQSITKEKLNGLYNEFKFDHLLLNLKADNCSLKCKTSLPKPGSDVKGNFCSASFNDVNIAKDFAFDVPDFKNLDIKHIYKIEELITGKEKNFEEMRINAKRKGKILRIMDIDGEHIEKDHDLLV